jgi:hypothetical protein
MKKILSNVVAWLVVAGVVLLFAGFIYGCLWGLGMALRIVLKTAGVLP